MVHDLMTALALVLILEGLLPGLAPGAYLKMLSEAQRMGQRSLRIIGIICMLSGALLLQFLK
ncbi:MAG: DUF2065 domain-containing protein [Xanthomonadales bacterium]|nr:DUF2065 domain-containing protein [Xanthomonadales bacterium]